MGGGKGGSYWKVCMFLSLSSKSSQEDKPKRNKTCADAPGAGAKAHDVKNGTREPSQLYDV